MNFLTPLFLVGALAVAGPIVFHLIRRAARERTAFSSLMFLKPSTPLTVRRKKLEHIWLLLLRCLFLLLVASAFARPFFSKDTALADAASEGHQYVLLLDTSASMRRAGVWDKARAVAESYVEKATPADQIAVMAFDRQLHTVVSFAEWASWSVDQRAALVQQRLAGVAPGWMGTQLGLALTGAAEEFPNSNGDKTPKSRAVILISDLQEGAKLDGLQGHEWPPDTRVVVERVEGKRESNAGLEILEQSPGAASVEHDIHVRVANASDSTKEKFRLNWSDTSGAGMDIYLPPGQSRTFTAPKMLAKTGKLQLSGDDVEFDDTAHYAAPEVEEVAIGYLGPDSVDDSTKLFYYLQRAFPATLRRQVKFVTGTALSDATFAVVPGKLAADECAALRDWMMKGKSALLVLTSADAEPTLAALLGLPEAQVTEAGGEYALFGQIDFKHPIFAPFDDPRYSDFSHIHFWKHRRWEIPTNLPATVLAKFDDDSPALTQVAMGKGHLLVLAAGWDPVDSQLAVSSKFPPLLQTMLQWSGASASARFQFRTGDAIPSPLLVGDAVKWQKPDAKETTLPAGAAFGDTDMPGIYVASWTGKQRQFAVNLPLEESRIAPLALDELGRLGVPLGLATEAAVASARVHQRHVQDSELENRQKIWRWLILAALAIVCGEIILSGWLASRAPSTEAAT